MKDPILVQTQPELIAALQSGNTVELGSDIYLTDSGSRIGIAINSVTGAVVNGNGFTIDGQNMVQCFFVSQSELVFNDLTVTRCHSSPGEYGGAFNIANSNI